MKLDISANRTICDVQHDFNTQYPFLKLDFYKIVDIDSVILIKELIPQNALLKKAGVQKTGFIEINDKMRVGELENILLDRFGLTMQVSRQTGTMWLETTMTNSWSLGKQNEYGREMTAAVKRNIV